MIVLFLLSILSVLCDPVMPSIAQHNLDEFVIQKEQPLTTASFPAPQIIIPAPIEISATPYFSQHGITDWVCEVGTVVYGLSHFLYVTVSAISGFILYCIMKTGGLTLGVTLVAVAVYFLCVYYVKWNLADLSSNLGTN